MGGTSFHSLQEAAEALTTVTADAMDNHHAKVVTTVSGSIGSSSSSSSLSIQSAAETLTKETTVMVLAKSKTAAIVASSSSSSSCPRQGSTTASADPKVVVIDGSSSSSNSSLGNGECNCNWCPQSQQQSHHQPVATTADAVKIMASSIVENGSFSAAAQKSSVTSGGGGTTTTAEGDDPLRPKCILQHCLRPKGSAIQEVTTIVNNHHYVTYAYHDSEQEEEDNDMDNDDEDEIEKETSEQDCMVECVETATRESSRNISTSTSSSSSKVCCYLPRTTATKTSLSAAAAAATPMRKRLRSSTATTLVGGKQQPQPGRDHSHEQSSSRIGNDYQVSFLPPSNTYNKLKQQQQASSLSLSSSLHNMCQGGDVLWDPVQARRKAAAATGGGDIHDLDSFINQGKNLDARMLLMESLHKTGYNISSSNNNQPNSPAMREFFLLAKGNTNVNVQVSMEEREKFAALFGQQKKIGLKYETADRVRWFAHIAQSTGYSVQQVLVQYYGWKADLKLHDVTQYKIMKRRLVQKKNQQQASNDYCCICDDGGILIICDGCTKSHHPQCLDPPVETIPDGEWFCPSCCNAKKQPPPSDVAVATKLTTTTVCLDVDTASSRGKNGSDSSSSSSSGSSSARTMTNAPTKSPVYHDNHVEPAAAFALDDDLSKDQHHPIIQYTGESSAQNGSLANKKQAKTKLFLPNVQNNTSVVNLEKVPENNKREKNTKSVTGGSSLMEDDAQPSLKRKMAQSNVQQDTGHGTKQAKKVEVPIDYIVAGSPPAPPIIQRKLPHWPQQQRPTPQVRHMQPLERTQSHDAYHRHYHHQPQQHPSAELPYSELLIRSCHSEPPPPPARVSTVTFPGVYQFFGSVNPATTQQLHQHYYQQQYQPPPINTAVPPVSQRGMCRQPFVLRRGTYFPTENDDVTTRAQQQQYSHHHQQQQQQQQHQTNSVIVGGPLSSMSRRGMSHRQPFVPRPRAPVMNSYNSNANAASAAILPSQFAAEIHKMA